jgi:hypothetical protein
LTKKRRKFADFNNPSFVNRDDPIVVYGCFSLCAIAIAVLFEKRVRISECIFSSVPASTKLVIAKVVADEDNNMMVLKT